MRKRKKPEDIARVTSFRLKDDVRAFLKSKADAADRTMSYMLDDFLRRWMQYDTTEAQQPKVPKK